MDAKDARRLKDLRAALKRAKPSDFLSLEHLAQLWGVSKPRFVTVMKEMVGFPGPQPAPKEMKLPPNSHVYAAAESIKAMIAFATRHEDAAKEKANRTAAILGRSQGSGDKPATLHTPNELQVLNRLANEVEERERNQRLYIAASEVAQTVGDIFSMITDFCASIPNKIDPHGELPPAARERAREGAADLQLHLYGRVKHLLAPDAVADGNRESSRRTRKPRASRARR